MPSRKPGIFPFNKLFCHHMIIMYNFVQFFYLIHTYQFIIQFSPYNRQHKMSSPNMRTFNKKNIAITIWIDNFI